MTLRDPEILGPVIGQRLLEVTGDGNTAENEAVCLHFENGYTITFPLPPEGFRVEGPE